MVYEAEKFELNRQLVEVQDEIMSLGDDYSPKELKALVNKRERIRTEMNFLEHKLLKLKQENGKDNR